MPRQLSHLNQTKFLLECPATNRDQVALREFRVEAKASMADDKSNAGSGSKRPYATLDLKATEVEITPVKAGASSAGAKASAAGVPFPAAARTYAEKPSDAAKAGAAQSKADAKADAMPEFLKKDTAKAEATSSASSASSRARDSDDEISGRKGGGFSVTLR